MSVPKLAIALGFCVSFGLPASTGCADEALDRVQVCGDLRVPADLVAVRVSVLNEGLTEVEAGVVELDGDAPRQLPVDVSMVHHSARRVVRAQAIGPDGVEVARSEVLVDADASDGIVVNLARTCLGQVCPLGQSCLDGACTVVPDARDPRLSCDRPGSLP